MKRINLTQHNATLLQGCVARSDEQASIIKALLTFEQLPDGSEIAGRANGLAKIASEAGADEAMVGGAPYLMGALDAALRMVGVLPVYAFSKRESVDETQPDGSVIKRGVFRHIGFVKF